MPTQNQGCANQSHVLLVQDGLGFGALEGIPITLEY